MIMSIFTQAYNSKSKEFEDTPLSARKRSKGKVLSMLTVAWILIIHCIVCIIYIVCLQYF